jgi:hypothetical protein
VSSPPENSSVADRFCSQAKAHNARRHWVEKGQPLLVTRLEPLRQERGAPAHPTRNTSDTRTGYRTVGLTAACCGPAGRRSAAGSGQGCRRRAGALGEALDLYGHLGPSGMPGGRLRGCGRFDARLGRRGLQRRQQTGWLSLTEMEQQVVGMVAAAGQPHPDTAAQLFISPPHGPQSRLPHPAQAATIVPLGRQGRRRAGCGCPATRASPAS